jgi:hypothetical protein
MNRIPLLLLLLCCAPAAQSEPLTPLDRISLSGGVFHSRISLDGSVSAEGTLDQEVHRYADDFALGERRRVRIAEFAWSPWERHEFVVRYHRDHYRRTVRLSEALEFSGETFPIDIDLRARAHLTGLEVDYTWWMYAGNRAAVGLQVGMLRLAAGFGLSGRVASDGNGEVTIDAEASDRLYAPLVGIAGRHVLGERVRLFGELRAIELGYDGIDGRAIAGSAGVEYFPHEHWGLVLQYSDTRVRARDDRSHRQGRAKGELEFGLRGAQLLLKFRR